MNKVKMKQVTRYQCPYCEELFKTPDRHKCKYSPESKNCYSCKHCIDFFGYDEYDDRSDGVERIPKETGIQCDKGYEIDAKEIGNGVPSRCDKYEYSGGKWFDNEHGKKRLKNITKEEQLF